MRHLRSLQAPCSQAHRAARTLLVPTATLSTLLFAFFVLCTASSCANEEALLEPAEAIRVIDRSRALTGALALRTALVEPIIEIEPGQSDADALEEAATEWVADECITAQSSASDIEIIYDACGENVGNCDGRVAVTLEVNDEGRRVWVLAQNDLTCGNNVLNEVIRLEETTEDELYVLTFAGATHYAEDDNSAPSIDQLSVNLLIRDAAYPDFDGEGALFEGAVVGGNLNWLDRNAARWLAEPGELFIQPYKNTPGNGDLALETPASTLYLTSWMPLSDVATRLEIDSRGQSWTGCLAPAGSTDCADAGFR